MDSYLQQYGVGDEERSRKIKAIVLSVFAALVIALFAYLFFHNFPERRVAKNFLSLLNEHRYKEAYSAWGCTEQHPCPNYDFQRFLRDWQPANNPSSVWKLSSSDSCKSFLTVNVEAPGAELQSLAIQRSDKSIGFAPSPECNERKWRFKQFFDRIFHGTPPPPPPPAK